MSLKRLARSLSTQFRKFTGKSDFKRWEQQDELLEDWDERTRLIADLIPDSTSIIEFGAGNMSLRKFIGPGCHYTPSDLVKRCEETVVYDLNADALPSHEKYDFAVFSGVLEYVNDIGKVAHHLCRHVDFVAVSYSPLEWNSKNRRRNGWVSDLNSQEFIEIFVKAGFTLEKSSRWRNQAIYLFRKIHLVSSA